MKLAPNFREPPHAGWALVLSGLFLVSVAIGSILLRESARWERQSYIEYGFMMGAFGAGERTADSLKALVGEKMCVAWWPPELRARSKKAFSTQ